MSGFILGNTRMTRYHLTKTNTANQGYTTLCWITEGNKAVVVMATSKSIQFRPLEKKEEYGFPAVMTRMTISMSSMMVIAHLAINTDVSFRLSDRFSKIREATMRETQKYSSRLSHLPHPTDGASVCFLGCGFLKPWRETSENNSVMNRIVVPLTRIRRSRSCLSRS